VVKESAIKKKKKNHLRDSEVHTVYANGLKLKGGKALRKPPFLGEIPGKRKGGKEWRRAVDGGRPGTEGCAPTIWVSCAEREGFPSLRRESGGGGTHCGMEGRGEGTRPSRRKRRKGIHWLTNEKKKKI